LIAHGSIFNIDPSMNHQEAILALLNLKGVGIRRVDLVLSALDPGEFSSLRAIVEKARSLNIRLPEASKMDLETASDKALRVIQNCDKKNITYFHKWNSDFPSALIKIPDAPVHLFVQGNHKVLNTNGVAVVGTRKPTNYGADSAYKIAARAVSKGFSVISGLAEGCDTQGHIGTLDSKGITVAVLAHGFGTIYPPSNRELAQRIIESGGCLLTEYMPDETTRPSNFIARDRLQSGLSRATIVIETGIEGGTMHTVKSTIKQGRLLGAVAHPQKYLGKDMVQGNQLLIRDGSAYPLAELEDLTAFLEQAKEHSTETSAC
jgi:DNA processing protein